MRSYPTSWSKLHVKVFFTDPVMPLKIEFFYSPYCTRCAAARRRMQALLIAPAGRKFIYHERNVLESLERAVELGVTATPALAVGGRLVNMGGWREAPLRALLATAARGN